ncbi:16S rRNA (cytosine(1402)-N(4))-methyltransferase RsmH [Patescibacteria group bacterium]|nr:16S rRNA (cytosine(1402)-N(4))-methyltransferase RsmH [Patescibacteria group bacterium]
MESKAEHIPVLLQEVCNEIVPQGDSFIVDCTLGLAGHSKRILESDGAVNLICFDLYTKSIVFFEKYLQSAGFVKEKGLHKLYKKDLKQVFLVNDNFANLKKVLDDLKIHEVSVILADLGLSTFQLKKSKRGFSFLNSEEPLDMRISLNNSVKAYELINSLSENELYHLFKNFGESEFSKIVSKRIVERRKTKQIRTVGDFLKVINLKKIPSRIHPATKLFMALRIAVNRESENLNLLLSAFLNTNAKKLLVITFHSLEVLSIRNFAKINNLKIKEILPTTQEILENKSSRSAKLYVLQK